MTSISDDQSDIVLFRKSNACRQFLGLRCIDCVHRSGPQDAGPAVISAGFHRRACQIGGIDIAYRLARAEE